LGLGFSGAGKKKTRKANRGETKKKLELQRKKPPGKKRPVVTCWQKKGDGKKPETTNREKSENGGEGVWEKRPGGRDGPSPRIKKGEEKTGEQENSKDGGKSTCSSFLEKKNFSKGNLGLRKKIERDFASTRPTSQLHGKRQKTPKKNTLGLGGGEKFSKLGG